MRGDQNGPPIRLPDKGLEITAGSGIAAGDRPLMRLTLPFNVSAAFASWPVAAHAARAYRPAFGSSSVHCVGD